MSYAFLIDELAKRGAVADALDTEHELIAVLIKALNTAIVSGAPHSIIVHLLDLVDEECRNHFVSEEEYMCICGCASLQAHKAAHSQLLERALRVRSAVIHCHAEGKLDAMDLLHDLENHIEHTDKDAYRVLRTTSGASGIDYSGVASQNGT